MSHADCAIRRAAKHEVPEIEALCVAAYEQYRDAIPPPIFGAYMEDFRNLSSRWDDAQFLVAEIDGRIAGSALLYADASSEGSGLPKGWAGFRKLAVHPSWRGRGVGRKISEKCVQMARWIGAPAVGVHTAAFMEAACNIYEQMGFRRCPEHDLRVSEILGIDDTVGDVRLIAYRLDLAWALVSAHSKFNVL